MDQTRRARIESVILEEVSHLLSREIKDPRIPSLAITRVELTQDAGLAQVFFVPITLQTLQMAAQGGPNSDGSNGWDSRQQADCLEGLKSAKGFVRRHLSRVLTLRQVPELSFKYDIGLQNTQRVEALLKEIHQEQDAKSLNKKAP